MVAISIRDTLSLTPRPDGPIDLACFWSSGLEARRRGWKRSHHQVSRRHQEFAGRGEATEVRGDPRREDPECEPSRGGPPGSPPRGTPWEPLPSASDNLVVHALERLRQCAGVTRGAQVSLSKRIPSAAGLGGASSDAAAALMAANQAWGLGWSSDRLAELAAELGSDIPFFLGSGAARCLGRGEKIESLSELPTLHFVVVRPSEGLSTAAVYRACAPSKTPGSSRGLVEAWRAGDWGRLGRMLHNGLQEPARQLSPEIARLQSVFHRCNVLGHQMSGSGTSYFGLCHHARHARQVAGRLQSQGLGAVYCASSERSLVSETWQTGGP
jgi:4-diphosphocytidyl-2-C-methyl-D-erythritol kinase